MKISKLVGERTKQAPNNAQLISHAYMLRAGYIKQVATGIYTLLMPAKKSILKIENIIREEMDALDGQEMLFPVVMPRELWDESGRYTSIGDEMARFQDRSNHDMVLGMTHEEAAVHACRNIVKSYDQLPCMVYQIQTKFRDEPRSRGGLIRVREFTMKDAYSFHTSQEDLEKFYQKAYDAYFRIFKRIGMKNVVAVKSDTGMMGGSVAHEFMLLTPAGEDTIVLCDNCDYKANMEVAVGELDKHPSQSKALEEVFTGDDSTIEEVCKLLNVEPYQTLKAVSYAVKGDTDKGVLVFIRGDLEVNEVKLKSVIKQDIVPNDLTDNKDIIAGYIGPKGLQLSNTTIIFDKSLEGEHNLVCGANKKGYHLANFDMTRDIDVKEFFDVAKIKEGSVCKVCGKGHLRLSRGIEIGNIFQLGTKYSAKMGMTVHDKDGNEINPIMGCYGIGVGRALASIVEESSDDKGMVLPTQIAPWQVYLCPLRYDDEKVRSQTDKLYDDMRAVGIEVILDDRQVSAGVKFADSELMGIPLRVVVSPRSLENNQTELSYRATGEKEMVDTKDIINKVLAIIDDSRRG